MKTLVKYILVLIATTVALCSMAQSYRIIPMVFCNTLDESIGKSCAEDMAKFLTEMGTIGAALGVDVETMYYFEGESCDKPNLYDALEDVEVAPDDVVFFYYSGHGARSAAASDDEWLPQMCLKYESYDQDMFVPMRIVVEKLKKKSPRLLIVMGDCCNNNKEWVTVKSLIEQQSGAVTLKDINVDNLNVLFGKSEGTIVMTSSEAGTPSIGTPTGGVFSKAWWDEIYRIEQNEAKPDWESLKISLIDRTLEYSSNKQKPEIRINDKVDIVPNPGPVPPDPKPVIVVIDNELKKLLMPLLDKNVSALTRADQAEEIAQKYFTPGARVDIVGRNSISVANTDIRDYLDELALSKTVNGLIIKKAVKSGDKYSAITVTEIR